MALNPTADRVAVPDGELRLWRYPRRTGLPTLHFAHATGFHGRTYAPLLERLTDVCNVIAWDMRGHGESGPLAAGQEFRGWEDYYRDLAALIDQEGPIFLAGHSVGATTSLVAAGRRPDAVRGVLLIDPVLLAPPARLLLAGARLLGLGDRFSLARLAARRRRTFPSADAMFRGYRGRGAFRTWPDAWLRAYVEHAAVPAGDALRLACDPAFEASSFAATETRPWARSRPYRGPLAVLVGERDSTCAPHSRKRLQRRHPLARVEIVPGTTHFLPMEAEALVAERVRELVAGPQPSSERSDAR